MPYLKSQPNRYLQVDITLRFCRRVGERWEAGKAVLILTSGRVLAAQVRIDGREALREALLVEAGVLGRPDVALRLSVAPHAEADQARPAP
eukprot:tig00000057_g81.t1